MCWVLFIIFSEKVPALDNETFAAWKRNKYAPDTLSADDKNLLHRHEEYLEEFLFFILLPFC